MDIFQSFTVSCVLAFHLQLDAYWFDESCLCNTCVVVTALRVSYSTGGSPKSFRFKSVSPWNISQWEKLTNVKTLPLSGKKIRNELSMVQSVVSPSKNKGKKKRKLTKPRLKTFMSMHRSLDSCVSRSKRATNV